MAEIPVERKGGAGWLVWLVVIVVVALLAWWLFGLLNDDSRVAAGDMDSLGVAVPPAAAPAVAPAEAADDAGADIVDVAAIVIVTDASALDGRRVNIPSAQVQSVVSDRGFWIGPSEGERVFAVRTNPGSPATPPDGAVNPGQTVALHGVIRAMPADLEQQRTAWNLGSLDLSKLQAQPVYIEVDSLTILQRP